MLSNGSGKARASRNGGARRRAEWRLLFMSSGEITLADKLSEIGKRPRAGQEVRLVDTPADAGVGLGAFEDLHNSATAGEFAERIKSATERFYGEPIRQFLKLVTEKYAADPAALLALLRESREAFLAANLPPGASGQVRTVCSRFALVATGGSLATAFDLTGWPDNEADSAAATCFRAWLDRRGGAADSEIDRGILQVRAFIEAHGASRFEAAWEGKADDSREATEYGHPTAGTTASKDRPERVPNRVGFRRRDSDGRWRYMILPEQWRTEVCKGSNATAVARAMVERTLLLPDGDGKTAQSVHVRGHGKMRLYCLAANIIADAEADDAR